MARAAKARAAQLSFEMSRLHQRVYKAIIFDLGRVLVHFDFEIAYRALAGSCAYAAADIPGRIFPNGLVRRFETGLIDSREFYARCSEVLGLRMDYARFCEILCSIFTETLLPESLFETLASRYRLVLLSNTNSIHFEAMRARLPHLRHFHHLVLSYEVMAMKPSPEIFRAAINFAQCRAEECFFTDDIPEYVEAARALGIDAVAFESREQIERELRSRGILAP
jgi:FMN phosphatase YigB (HAD superfamily)